MWIQYYFPDLTIHLLSSHGESNFLFVLGKRLPTISASRKWADILRVSEVTLSSQLAANCHFQGTQPKGKLCPSSLMNAYQELPRSAPRLSKQYRISVWKQMLTASINL